MQNVLKNKWYGLFERIKYIQLTIQIVYYSIYSLQWCIQVLTS